MIKRTIVLSLLGVILASCSTIKERPYYRLRDGRYDFKQEGSRYSASQIYVHGDTVKIFSAATNKQVIPDPLKEQYFLKRTLDVDVITVPFKFRPAYQSLPRQLTTDFNGNVFLGYRMDRIKITHQQTPIGLKETHKHRTLSVGGFAGLGSTPITPWTTDNQVNQEYSGFILTRGIALMVGINNLTVGLGVGKDSLTDRDKAFWIYQNKLWYGLTLGLNLN